MRMYELRIHAHQVLMLFAVVAQCNVACQDSNATPPEHESRRVRLHSKRCECSQGRVKLLHVTRHAGLQMEVLATMRHFCCIDVETFFFNDGINVGDGDEAGLNWNVHSFRSQAAWNAHGAWFQTFDAVLVSDVTAFSRPFLEQSQFRKPLFLWICNRFDFANQDHEFVLAHTDMLQHGYFPDERYYSVMRAAAKQPNVTILLSNRFESHYAQHWRGVDWSDAPLLYPAGLGGRPSLSSPPSTHTCAGTEARVSGEEQVQDLLHTPGLYGDHSLEALPPPDLWPHTVLIPDRGIVSSTCPSHEGSVNYFYNNEVNLGVADMLRARGFKVYHGRYGDAEQASRFMAVVRVPNNYMTTAFHQLLAAGAVMLVPSRSFLLSLANLSGFWWNTHWDVESHRELFETSRQWSCPEQFSTLSPETLEYAYEYDERHAEGLVYFESWDDLENKLRTTDFGAARQRALSLSNALTKESLDQWAALLQHL